MIRAVAIGLVITLSAAGTAVAQGYLPPKRYMQPAQRPQQPERPERPAAEADPLEYYAEDWIVLDAHQQVLCKDPYVRRDVKIIECVADATREPIR